MGYVVGGSNRVNCTGLPRLGGGGTAPIPALHTPQTQSLDTRIASANARLGLPTVAVHLRLHPAIPRRGVHAKRFPPRAERVTRHRPVVAVRPHAVTAPAGSVARARRATTPAATVGPAGVVGSAPRGAAGLRVACLRGRRLASPAVRVGGRLPVLPLAPHLPASRSTVAWLRARRPTRRLPREPVGYANPRLAVRGYRAGAAGYVTKLAALVRRLVRPAVAPRSFTQRFVRGRPASVHDPCVLRHVALLRRVVLDIRGSAILRRRLNFLEGEEASRARTQAPHQGDAKREPFAFPGAHASQSNTFAPDGRAPVGDPRLPL